MQREYRVVDLSTGSIDPEQRLVKASSPENAALEILGHELVRSGAKKDLAARVYWAETNGPTNMVRLYRKVDSTRIR